jgi:hypothetical protein
LAVSRMEPSVAWTVAFETRRCLPGGKLDGAEAEGAEAVVDVDLLGRDVDRGVGGEPDAAVDREGLEVAEAQAGGGTPAPKRMEPESGPVWWTATLRKRLPRTSSVS